MNKASGGDGIPVMLFQILKDAVKVLHSICQQIWKTCHSGHRTGKDQFSFQLQRRAMPECSNYCTIALISYTSKVLLKIIQARIQQYVNHEL